MVTLLRQVLVCPQAPLGTGKCSTFQAVTFHLMVGNVVNQCIAFEKMGLWVSVWYGHKLVITITVSWWSTLFESVVPNLFDPISPFSGQTSHFYPHKMQYNRRLTINREFHCRLKGKLQSYKVLSAPVTTHPHHWIGKVWQILEKSYFFKMLDNFPNTGSHQKCPPRNPDISPQWKIFPRLETSGLNRGMATAIDLWPTS